MELPVGCTSTSCAITLGSGLISPTGVAVDGAGNIYVAEYGFGTQDNTPVYKMSPGCTNSSCMTPLGGGFDNPTSVAVDGAGNVYVAAAGGGDSFVGHVYIVPVNCLTASCVTDITGGSSNLTAVAVDPGGNVFIGGIGFDGGALWEMAPGCTSFTCMTSLGGGWSLPSGITIDAANNLYVSDSGQVKMMPETCTNASCVTALPGSFYVPEGLTIDSSGNLYLAVSGENEVMELNRSTAPTLNFPATNIGSTNTETTSLLNIGNSALTLSSSLDFTHPVFTLDSATTCSSSASSTLAAGANCLLAIDFTPLSTGSLNGSLVLTDTNLNANPSTTQTITFTGVGVATVPGAPTGATATAGNAQATVSFTPPASNGGATITSYTVTSLIGGFTATGSSSPITVTGLTNGTAYSFTVTATNSVGPGPASGASNSVTPAVPDNTITFPSLGTQVIFGDVAPPLLGATADSGLAVSYATTGATSILNGYLNITGPGVVIVTASQAGNGTYPSATPVEQTLTVTPANFTAVGTGTQAQGTASVVTVTLQFNAAFTLGSLSVVNNGASGSPFVVASGGTCAVGNPYTPGASCTVALSYTPTGPGMITGTVEALDSNGLLQAATNAVALRGR